MMSSGRGRVRRSDAKRHKEDADEQQELAQNGAHNANIALHMLTNQTAMLTIIRFSVKEMKPSGTLLPLPTQAHFSSRLST